MESKTRELTTFVVHQWQCDHFGHLNVRHYASMFDDSIFVFWGRHRPERDDPIVPVTADMRIGFRAEAVPGTVVKIESTVQKVGTKSVGLGFQMIDLHSCKVLATCDVVEVFFNLESRESQPIPAALRANLEAQL